jgi:hypothetical protein
MFIQRTTAILAAVMGGFGVFFAVYSSASPEVAAKAIVLLVLRHRQKIHRAADQPFVRSGRGRRAWSDAVYLPIESEH